MMQQTAMLRAQWLAQLGDAIESAQRLAWQLGTHDGTSREARKLYGRLEAARLELDALRGCADRQGRTPDPELLQRLGWGSDFKGLD